MMAVGVGQCIQCNKKLHIESGYIMWSNNGHRNISESAGKDC